MKTETTFEVGQIEALCDISFEVNLLGIDDGLWQPFG